MQWQGKKVLVTGAGGFIGSHLTERLVELGADVRAFVHYNAQNSSGWLDQSPRRDALRIIAGDITDGYCVREAARGVDVIFHLAALIAIPYSYHAPASYVRTNVEGTLNVLQAARDCGAERLVHTSTSEVYGTARQVPISETHPLQGQSPYSASKIGADKIAEAFQLSFDVPVVTVRPFNTFGPRQSARAVIPVIITQCLAGNTVRLGNLLPTRDLNFVANTVEGFICAAVAEKAVGQTFNLGSGREISIGNLAQLIARLMGKAVSIETESERLRPDKSEVERLLADNSRACEVLSWTPKIDLESGLKITIDWMRENLGRYRPGKYVI
ncbi:TPA: NAD-dependent dehydratase [Candidatus Sumerlaeota bacterium]|jgi:NAD dependent epimerase/dehydratase|nr:NAD-dependent dehydratase [Candidatus Sumerlaeota bacterium]